MKRLFLLALILGISLITLPAMAQQAKGDTSLNLYGSFMTNVRTEGADRMYFGTIALGVGQFLSDRTEFGAGADVQFWNTDVTISPKVSIRFYGAPKKTVPYFEGAAVFYNIANNGGGFDVGDGEGSNFSDRIMVRPAVGFKNFISEKAAIDFNAGYDALLKHFDNGFLDVRVGFTYLF